MKDKHPFHITNVDWHNRYWAYTSSPASINCARWQCLEYTRTPAKKNVAKNILMNLKLVVSYIFHPILKGLVGEFGSQYSETWELGTPKGLWKTVLNSKVVLFLRSISTHWIGIWAGVAVLNSQVVPISQVVLKAGFTVYCETMACSLVEGTKEQAYDGP